MKIVIAPDSFKGSLTAFQASEVMKKAILDVSKNSQVTLKPMSDGGEGTLQSFLTSNEEGVSIPIACTGPLGVKLNTNYAIVNSRTAIIECARIAGLVKVPASKRNPDFTTSVGVGEVIKDALDKGCTSLVIGIGGSATNDSGLGMLLALGMEAWDINGDKVGFFGKDLRQVYKVSFSKIDPRLKDIDIKVASDVENILCGDNGATFVYGPQKGATKKQLKDYDQLISRFGDMVESVTKTSLKEIPGSGAAGGIGFALLAIGAEIISGAEFLADEMKLEESIQNADLVLTGEGQSDEQTLFGKAPSYIASLGNKHNVPVLLISGSLSGDLNVVSENFSGCFSIVNRPLTLEQCMEKADVLLYEQTKQIFQMITSLSHKKALSL